MHYDPRIFLSVVFEKGQERAQVGTRYFGNKKKRKQRNNGEQAQPGHQELQLTDYIGTERDINICPGIGVNRFWMQGRPPRLARGPSRCQQRGLSGQTGMAKF